jgi:hypothetical protein
VSFPKNNHPNDPSAFSENKPSPTGMEKSYRLMNFLPKIPKNLTDEPGSQHRILWGGDKALFLCIWSAYQIPEAELRNLAGSY